MKRRTRKLGLWLLGGLGALGAALGASRANTGDAPSTLDAPGLAPGDGSITDDDEGAADVGSTVTGEPAPELPGWRAMPGRRWDGSAAADRLDSLIQGHGYRAGARIRDRLRQIERTGAVSSVYDDATAQRVEALAERLAAAGIDEARAEWVAAASAEAMRAGVPSVLAVQWAITAADAAPRRV